MRRPKDDMDKIIDLLLYIFPKYLDRISDQRNNRFVTKKKNTPNRCEKVLLKENKFKDDNKENKSEYKKNDALIKSKEDKSTCKGGDKMINDKARGSGNDKDDDKEIEQNIDKNTDKGIDKDIDKNIDKDIEKEIGSAENKIGKSNIIVDNDIKKSEVYNSCVYGIEKILKELIGEKVDISITDSTMFLLNSVIVLSVEETIVKLKTVINTTIVVPIQEIVAIRCDLIYGINFEDNCNLDVREKDDGLRKYFSTIIGKKVFIQTKGEGEFKYINNRIITGTAKGIVILEGTIAISLSKISLVEEAI